MCAPVLVFVRLSVSLFFACLCLYLLIWMHFGPNMHPCLLINNPFRRSWTGEYPFPDPLPLCLVSFSFIALVFSLFFIFYDLRFWIFILFVKCILKVWWAIQCFFSNAQLENSSTKFHVASVFIILTECVMAHGQCYWTLTWVVIRNKAI